jgi:hypothetical protein
MFAVVFSAFILIAVPAFAAYPLITDDPDTQGKGKFQLEVNAETGFDDQTDAPGAGRRSVTPHWPRSSPLAPERMWMLSSGSFTAIIS